MVICSPGTGKVNSLRLERDGKCVSQNSTHPLLKRLGRVTVVLTLLPLFLFTPNASVLSDDQNTQQAHISHISSDEFLSSSFARLFKKHQYKKALDALKELSRK